MGFPSIDGLTLPELFELRANVAARLVVEVRPIATAVQHMLAPEGAGTVAAPEPVMRPMTVTFTARHVSVDEEEIELRTSYELPISIVGQGLESVLQAIREMSSSSGTDEELKDEDARS